MKSRRVVRRLSTWALFGVLGAGVVSPAMAEDPPGEEAPVEVPKKVNKAATKKAAGKALKRTRKVLEAAAKAAREGGKLKSRLRNAVAHQRGAEAAVRSERYDVAVFLTLEARKLSGHVLKANAAKPPKEIEPVKEELSAAEGVVESDGSGLVAAVELNLPDEDALAADLDATVKKEGAE